MKEMEDEERKIRMESKSSKINQIKSKQIKYFIQAQQIQHLPNHIKKEIR
jgi:hypothetical protein